MLVLFWLWTTSAFAAMSTSEVRENARFMTDRMAYELGLSSMQRNDVYEINYDFFESVRFVMDDLATGYSYAIDRYYESLDLRNDDLSYVLTRGQFERFMSRDYFYRPLYVDNRVCRIRIYSVYTNPSFYYYAAPLNFLTYVGLHSRAHYVHGFYCNRYHHPRYTGVWVRPSRHVHYAVNRRHDFGPGIAGRPASRPPRPVVRPPYDNRPSRPAVRPPYDNRPSRPAVRPPHDNRPSRPDVRPPHDNRPSRPDVRPPHDNRPSRPAVRPSHDNRPSRPDVRPPHDNRPQKPNARPSHDKRPQRPSTRPSTNNRPSRPSVRPSDNNRPSRPNTRPSERNSRPQRGEGRTVRV